MDPSSLMVLVSAYRYPILIPAAFFWGLLVCMVSGVAIRVGYLDFAPAYACLMIGELLGDVVWYWVGYRWGESFTRRFGKYVGITESSIATAKRLFRKYNQRILVSSKLTTGFGLAIPILFTAGLSHVSFSRYMLANMSGQLFWTGGLIAIGYYFGDFYLKVDSAFAKISAVSLFIVLILLFIGFSRYLGTRMRKNLSS